MEMKEVKERIKSYMTRHYKYYGRYPYEIMVDDIVYNREEYMHILSMTVKKLSTFGCIRVRIHYNKYITQRRPLCLTGATIESMCMEIQTQLTK